MISIASTSVRRGPIRSVNAPHAAAAAMYTSGQAPSTVPMAEWLIARSRVTGCTSGASEPTIMPKQA
jgi:hypothetical protein